VPEAVFRREREEAAAVARARGQRQGRQGRQGRGHDSGTDTAPAGLETYHRRRDFSRTGEPHGGGSAQGTGGPGFVVQIHDASSMHFDFRLEVDGVLKSWAVPKGPSADPHDKRLAMPTEDHPLEYRAFEGVIGEGQYGAGTVIVWDEGGYESLATDRRGHEVPFAEALRHGHASFRLHGSKLHGGYALTRFRQGDAEGKGEAWLLVKRDEGGGGRAGGGHGSGGAPDPWRARSVLSGRTLRQVAEEAGGAGGEGER
jgi:DNA ligase D-like protein (predicted 3'-phosphoesterase)